MAGRTPRNVSASVFARLKNLRTPDRDLNQLLQRFTAERFLYRLSISPEADNFALKGATLFLVWCGDALRSTRDVDVVRYEYGGRDALRETLARISAEQCPEDGITFAPETIAMSDLPVDPDLPGRAVRAKLRGQTGHRKAVAAGRRRVRRDDHSGPEACGDPDTSRPSGSGTLDCPTGDLLSQRSFMRWRASRRRYTRIKDIWDVAALAVRFTFDGRTLLQAVDHTFAQRGTIPEHAPPPPLRASFYDVDRASLWRSFQRSSTVWAAAPATLAEAGDIAREFLTPVWESAARKEPFDLTWPPGGPWVRQDRSRLGIVFSHD